MEQFSSVLAFMLLVVPKGALTGSISINTSEPVVQTGDGVNITCSAPLFLPGNLVTIMKHVENGTDQSLSTNGILESFPGRDRYTTYHSRAGQGYNFHLDIRDMQPEDAGIYKCSLKSTGPAGEASSLVTVLAQPTVEITVSKMSETIVVSEDNWEVFFAEDEHVLVTCNVNNSIPEPNVTIQLNNMDITEGFTYNTSNITSFRDGNLAFSATYHSVLLTKNMVVLKYFDGWKFVCEARIHPMLASVSRNFTIKIGEDYGGGSQSLVPLSSWLVGLISILCAVRHTNHL